MRIRTTRIFERAAKNVLSAQERRELEEDLNINPTKGPLIRGAGGLRKIRVAVGAKGKSGGARVIYYHVASNQEIFLLYAYLKKDRDNISKAQLKSLAKYAKELK
jgi:hypothetical protein